MSSSPGWVGSWGACTTSAAGAALDPAAAKGSSSSSTAGGGSLLPTRGPRPQTDRRAPVGWDRGAHAPLPPLAPPGGGAQGSGPRSALAPAGAWRGPWRAALRPASPTLWPQTAPHPEPVHQAPSSRARSSRARSRQVRSRPVQRTRRHPQRQAPSPRLCRQTRHCQQSKQRTESTSAPPTEQMGEQWTRAQRAKPSAAVRSAHPASVEDLAWAAETHPCGWSARRCRPPTRPSRSQQAQALKHPCVGDESRVCRAARQTLECPNCPQYSPAVAAPGAYRKPGRVRCCDGL